MLTDEDDFGSTNHAKDKPKGTRIWTWVCINLVSECVLLATLWIPRCVFVPGAKQVSKTPWPVSLLECLPRERNADPNSLQLVLCDDGKPLRGQLSCIRCRS